MAITNFIEESELSKVENSLLNKNQLNFLLSPTPVVHIYERPAKGGGKWKYVTGTYVKKVLNLMFGWDWSFEIVGHEVSLEYKQVIVKGKLTVHSGGRDIVKMQFGRQDIKFRRDSSNPLDLGNDLKGATTDALKKCASELGIASDVYAPNEFKAIQVFAEEEPSRGLEELTKMFGHITTLDELKGLWESLNSEERKTANDLKDAKKSEL